MDEFHKRLRTQETRVLDLMDGVLDSVSRASALPAPPLAVARRQLANTLRLWRACEASRCRRAQCCRGEPLDCLRIGLTLLPMKAFEPLITSVKGRAKKERRARRESVSAVL